MVTNGCTSTCMRGGTGRSADAARVEGLGAGKLWFHNDRGAATRTMADMEGNEFCGH